MPCGRARALPPLCGSMSAYISGLTLNGATVQERLLQTVQDRLRTNPGTRPTRMDYGAGLGQYIDEELAQIETPIRFRVQSALNADANISVSRVRVVRANLPHEIDVTVDGVSPLVQGSFQVTV